MQSLFLQTSLHNVPRANSVSAAIYDNLRPTLLEQRSRPRDVHFLDVSRRPSRTTEELRTSLLTKMAFFEFDTILFRKMSSVQFHSLLCSACSRLLRKGYFLLLNWTDVNFHSSLCYQKYMDDYGIGDAYCTPDSVVYCVYIVDCPTRRMPLVRYTTIST